MTFTQENTTGFSDEELDELNAELVRRLASDELEGFPEYERIIIISQKILDRY